MHKTVKVDTQCAYLGTTNRDDLIKAVGLMSNKRGPRAPVKLDAEDFKNRQLADFSALIVERNRRLDILKACQRSRNPSTGKTPRAHQLAGPIHGIRRDLGRTALRDSRAKWFENADIRKVRVWLPSEVPNLGYISLVEAMTSN